TNYAPLFGAKYLDSKGKSQVSKQFAFSKILRWQKSLVDWYGYDNLVRFQAKPADEFSASNAFETGRIAMIMDGEWRVAFIHAEHPEPKYATAPMPLDGAHPELYRAGSVNGAIIGIPKGGQDVHPDSAVGKDLETNNQALAR